MNQRARRAGSCSQPSPKQAAQSGLQRLQKVIAHAGRASRRAAEEYILAGRVTVNGQIVRELGTKVNPVIDVVRVDGRELPRGGEPARYLKLFKPYGVLSTFFDPHGRPTLAEYVQTPERVYTVGRLDMDSEGLLLLTNDGALTHYVTHPRYEHPKEYWVLVEGVPSEEALQVLRRGVEVEGRRTAPARVTCLQKLPANIPPREVRNDVPTTWLRMILREGRKRQIRHMTAAVGHPTLRLVRVAVGPVQLGNLAVGEWRDLTAAEVQILWNMVRSVQLEKGKSE